jgi:outer membrane protein assembly factor BamE (lipoprotein component of BamABCDE complex)
MVKRRRIIALLLLLLLGLPCTLFYLASGSGDRASRANFDKLQIGMTLEQVEALLGTPDIAHFDGQLIDPPRIERGPGMAR